MRRGVFDLLRRGVDSTIANWHVSLIRFLEAVLFMLLAVGAVLAILIPILLSLGIHLGGLDTPDDFEALVDTLMSRWLILLWIFIGISLLLLAFVVIHSFVEAGCARVLVDADRVAGPELNGPRSRYKVFSMERWTAGGKAGFWPVFWIYNIAWAVAGLIMLIPLVPTIALMLVFREQEGVAVLSGCLGMIVTVMLMLLVAIVAALLTNRAIVAWAAHHTGARESLRIGWEAIKADVGRHVLTALAIMVVGMAGSMFFASFSFFAGLGESMGSGEVFMLVTLPLRLIGQVLNSALSALLGSWYLATYAALALDPKR